DPGEFDKGEVGLGKITGDDLSVRVRLLPLFSELGTQLAGYRIVTAGANVNLQECWHRKSSFWWLVAVDGQESADCAPMKEGGHGSLTALLPELIYTTIEAKTTNA